MIAIIGSLSLGIVVGWLVRYFLARLKRFTIKTLTTLLSIVIGGTIIKLLGNNSTVIWCYPIGLLAGFIIYTVVALFVAKYSQKLTLKETAKKGLRNALYIFLLYVAIPILIRMLGTGFACTTMGGHDTTE